MSRVTAVVVLLFGLMVGGVASPSPVAAASSEYVAVPPVRVTDTRTGFPIDDQGPNPKGLLGDGNVLRIPVAGRAGIPKDATAVAVNLTAPRPTTPGYLTVFACDAPQPSTSNLNLQAGNTVANMVFSKIGASGDVCVFVRGTTNIIVDVVGYVPTGGTPILIAPKRVTDTRAGFPIDDQGPNPKGEPADGTVLRVPIAGRAGVPTGSSAALLNLTAPKSTTLGYLAVYACDTPRPTTSSLNLQPDATIANAVLTNIGPKGDVCVLTRGTTNIVIDVLGYVPTDATPTLVMPKRVVDTRTDFPIDDQGANPKGERADGTVLRVPVAGRVGIPADAGAAVLNVTAPNATTPGYLTVYACDARQPSTSNVNLQPGKTIANAVITAVGPKGDVCIFTRGTTNIIVDVTGFTLQPRTIESSCTIGGTAVKTALPQTECDALVAIYNANNGPNWLYNDRWNTATDPCTWYGVTCANATVTELSFWSNGLTGALPTQLGNLTGLTYLGLLFGDLTQIPNEIGYLSKLETLDLTGNKIAQLPAQVGNLPKLTTLNMSGNPIGSIPPQIGRLKTLTTLTIDQTGLTAVPSEIGNLTNLRELYLDGNNLTALPTSIGNLTSLRTLGVRNNLISALPTETGNLSNLEDLYLSNNELTALPTEIGKLTNLVRIDAEGNQISSIPAQIGELIDLTSLDLSRNALTELPAEFANLTKLEYLALDVNQLTSVPVQIGKFTGLQYLYLQYNRISGDVSSTFAPLVAPNVLRSLGLVGNDCPFASDLVVKAWLDRVSPGWDSCGINRPVPSAAESNAEVAD